MDEGFGYEEVGAGDTQAARPNSFISVVLADGGGGKANLVIAQLAFEATAGGGVFEIRVRFFAYRGAKVLEAERSATGENDRSLDDVLELAHIP